MSLATLDNQDQFVKQELTSRYSYKVKQYSDACDLDEAEAIENELLLIEIQLRDLGVEV